MTEQRLTSEREAEIRSTHEPYGAIRELGAELDALRAESDRWKAKAVWLADRMVCRGWTPEYWLAAAERAVGGSGE